MKTTILIALTSLVLAPMLPTSAFANHRTGSFALPELLAAGDFDHDGNLDLAVNVTGFDNVAIYKGDGKGGLKLTSNLPSDTLTKGLDVADIDSDGRLDLVGATAWGYDVLVHLGDGAGGFGARDQVYDADGEPTRLILRDFNKDGRPDIAVNAPDSGKILVYLNNGQGGFGVPAIEVADLPRGSGLTSGDFNGDGKLDLIACTTTSHKTGAASAVLLLGDGTGHFTKGGEMSVSPFPTSVQTTDLNHDGKLDFVVAGAEPGNQTGNFFQTFLGDGAGHFTPVQTTPLGKGNLKGEISLGDFNEDGNVDLAYPVTGNQDRVNTSHTVLIYFGDGAGNFTAGPSLQVGTEPHSVATPDFNKDGHLDLVVSNRTDGTVSLFLGDGKGNFTLSVTRSVLSPELDPIPARKKR